MEEKWKYISGYENYLEVSSLGRIRSVSRQYIGRNGSVKTLKPKILSTVSDKKGYKRCTTSVNGKKITLKVHRAVAAAFIENPLSKPQVDHIDGDKTNNCVENLRWVSNKENFEYSVENGLRVKSFNTLNLYRNSELGIKNLAKANRKRCGKKTACYTRDGELVAVYETAIDAAQKLGLTFSSGINSCCLGRLPTYKGYIWKYLG